MSNAFALWFSQRLVVRIKHITDFVSLSLFLFSNFVYVKNEGEKKRRHNPILIGQFDLYECLCVCTTFCFKSLVSLFFRCFFFISEQTHFVFFCLLFWSLAMLHCRVFYVHNIDICTRALLLWHCTWATAIATQYPTVQCAWI